MNITKYIQSNPELSNLNFHIVYQTIITLIGDGVLSMEDFNKVKAVKSSNGFYKKSKRSKFLWSMKTNMHPKA